MGHVHTTGISGLEGIWVTNFPPDLQALHTGRAPLKGWPRSFPADGVAVQIWIGERFPVAVLLRDSTFPLSPSSFHRITPARGTAPRLWMRDIEGDGLSCTVAVWLGSHASRTQRHAAWAVVESLRFPRLREGTIWHGTYYVLGRASRYPAGSVTTFLASSLPPSRSLSSHVPEGFYLVHAPRAFYVIDRMFQESAPFSSIGCALAFDPKVFQFYCPGTRLRWSRGGQPVGGHAHAGPDRALPLHVATVAQDGRILFSPFFGGLLHTLLRGSPWQ